MVETQSSNPTSHLGLQAHRLVYAAPVVLMVTDHSSTHRVQVSQMLHERFPKIHTLPKLSSLSSPNTLNPPTGRRCPGRPPRLIPLRFQSLRANRAALLPAVYAATLALRDASTADFTETHRELRAFCVQIPMPALRLVAPGPPGVHLGYGAPANPA